MNRLKNEQKLMNKFQKVFGDKNDVVVCFGDFEQSKSMEIQFLFFYGTSKQTD